MGQEPFSGTALRRAPHCGSRTKGFCPYFPLRSRLLAPFRFRVDLFRVALFLRTFCCRKETAVSRHRPRKVGVLGAAAIVVRGGEGPQIAGGSFTAAILVPLSTTDTGTQTGQIERRAGDIDVLQIYRPASGNLVVREVSGPSIVFPTAPSACTSASHRVLASRDPNVAGSLTSRVVTSVVKGDVDHVTAAAVGRRHGAYSLQFCLDAFGETFATAATIAALQQRPQPLAREARPARSTIPAT